MSIFRRRRKKRSLLSLIRVVISVIVAVLITFALSVILVEKDKPYLVAADYSTITYYDDDVYVRINELPDNAYPEKETLFDVEIWEEARLDGLSKLDQFLQVMQVKLYTDDEGNKYLWLVDNYPDEILGEGEDGEDKDYDDFDEHYVYFLNTQPTGE